MFIATPGLAYGLLCFYFKILRRGHKRAWFDVPAAYLLFASVMLINITAVLVGTAVQNVTGIELAPPPPHTRRPPQSG